MIVVRLLLIELIDKR